MTIRAEHLERQDEKLRIPSDDDFNAITAQLKKAGKRQSSRQGRSIAPFTGLVYCACGAKCYRVKSENKKGSYSYYVCGRSLRQDDCPHAARIHESDLVAFVKRGFEHVLSRADEIIGRAVEIAADAAQSNRGDADRIRAEIKELQTRHGDSSRY